MIVLFTARRLKPGTFHRFREAWEQRSPVPLLGLRRAYLARNVRDPDEVISFGLFNTTVEEYRRWREAADREENLRVERLSEFTAEEPVSGVYEVAVELLPDGLEVGP